MGNSGELTKFYGQLGNKWVLVCLFLLYCLLMTGNWEGGSRQGIRQ